MTRILVWDLPTRALHWLLVATAVAALGIALIADDDGGAFQLHMLLGLIAAFVALLRVVWGLVGSRYARFGSFLFGPRALIAYLCGVLRRTGERHVGHNPGSAYATYAMLLLTLGLSLSGLLLRASSKALEELHEVMAYALLVVVGAHVVGLVLHTIRHREGIAWSMVDGRKDGAAAQAIGRSHATVGIVFMALAAGWTALVFSGHDARAGRLTLLGRSFYLGEPARQRSRDDRRHRRERRGGRHHRGHDDRHHEHHDDDH